MRSSEASPVPRYTCCICQLDAVTDHAHTCADCREVFMVADDQDPEHVAASRTPIGPTDV